MITTGLNINNVSITELPLSDHHCILFDTAISLIKTRKEVIFQKRHLDDKSESNFSDLFSQYEPQSDDNSLNEMV